jgi:hypothetical protein
MPKIDLRRIDSLALSLLAHVDSSAIGTEIQFDEDRGDTDRFVVLVAFVGMCNFLNSQWTEEEEFGQCNGGIGSNTSEGESIDPESITIMVSCSLAWFG